MSRSRVDFQYLLEKILGSRNVYFQPPATIQMKYPAIVYSLNDINSIHANNDMYLQKNSYEVILIDKNPDSKTPSELLKVPYSRFDRSYTSDNLNHFVFTINY